MTAILLILAIIVGVAGFFCLSEATMGVGLLGTACLIGIIARLIQADSHHHKLMKRLNGKRLL